MTAKRIKAPTPRTEGEGPYRRQVTVPATLGTYDTDEPHPPKDKTRSYFRDEEFVRVIDQHGKFVVWRKALLCPCHDETVNQAQVDCVNCGGSGFIYVDPIQVRALMLQFDKRTSIYERFGLWQEGAVQITTLPKYRLGYRDSIEMQDEVMPFTELLKKENRRGIRSALPDGVDSARFRIQNVAKLGMLKAGSPVFLEQGYHFDVTKEGWIRWTSAGERTVPKDTTLSIHYDFHPVFLVLSWMHVTRSDVSAKKQKVDVVQALPIQAMAKLAFLIDVNTVPDTTPGVAVPGPSGAETGDGK